MTEFVLATANPDKVAEISAILGPAVRLLPRPLDVPEVVEDADTLVGNARLKAAALVAATGLPAIADDTGLEVDALDGAPGVYSARFAGDGATYADNVTKMLAVLKGVPATGRTARFRTVALIRWPSGEELSAEGVVAGSISSEPRGAAGFGYDPIFVADEAGGLTFAELSAEEKHAISHRGRAFRALADLLDKAAG